MGFNSGFKGLIALGHKCNSFNRILLSSKQLLRRSDREEEKHLMFCTTHRVRTKYGPGHL